MLCLIYDVRGVSKNTQFCCRELRLVHHNIGSVCDVVMAVRDYYTVCDVVAVWYQGRSMVCDVVVVVATDENDWHMISSLI